MTTTGFLTAVFGPRDAVLDGVLRHSLLEQRMPTIMVDDAGGRVLEFITRLKQPCQIMEIGTLFGYSTIYMARGLPPNGLITTLEQDSSAAALARENFERAGVAERVDLIVGDAVEYLARREPESVDMVFIDGDKRAYPTYLKHAIRILAPGGVLVADDAYADYGETTNDVFDAAERAGVHTYNLAVGRSPQLFSALLGTRNGMLASVKIPGGAR